jgi:hypothetical protein
MEAIAFRRSKSLVEVEAGVDVVKGMRRNGQTRMVASQVSCQLQHCGSINHHAE